MFGKRTHRGIATTRRRFLVQLPLGAAAFAIARNAGAQSGETANSRNSFCVGIQTHAHDFLHEGTEHVITTSREKAGVNAVLTCATYVKENMRLPHNPKFDRYPTQGGFYFDFDPQLYEKTGIKPVRTPEENFNNFDAIRSVSAACRKLDVRFHAWVSSFNYPQEGPSYPDHQVVSAGGERHTGWFCPNSPEAREFSLTVYEDLVRNCQLDGVFVDRFRFPDDITTCFCDHCVREMRKRDLDPDSLRRAILAVAGKTPMMSYLSLTTLGLSIDPVFYICELPELADLVRFKTDTITSYVETLYKRVKAINPKVEVGLDMFSPSVAWQVGQDPTRLAHYCDWIKPMLYHLSDGYHAIRAVRTMAEQGLGSQQELYERMRRMLTPKGMELPDTFEEFRRTSFPTSWVETEMTLTQRLMEERKPLYAGIQVWPTTTPDIVNDAIRAAVRARSDGVFLYCYGWSPMENLEAAGQTLRQLQVI